MNAARNFARWLLALSFAAIGVAHFTHTEAFATIVPPPLPARACVLVSGVFEILGGIGVLVPRLRRAAGWGLMVLVLAVFPANIYSAVANVPPGGIDASPLALWLRLPFQFVIWAWIWWTTLARPRPLRENE